MDGTSLGVPESASTRQRSGMFRKSKFSRTMTMAEQYAFADDMFQTNEGPTFPAHQYLVSGTSTISQGSQYVVDNNPGNLSLSKNGGCQSAPSSTVESINITTGAPGPNVYPCFERQTLMDLIMASPRSRGDIFRRLGVLD